MEDMKERKDTFEMPEVPNVNIPQLRDGGLTNGHGLSNGLSNGVTMRDHSGGAGGIKRGSIKRQSEIMREKKMSRQEEREEERKRKESYFRKVTGLFYLQKTIRRNIFTKPLFYKCKFCISLRVSSRHSILSTKNH